MEFENLTSDYLINELLPAFIYMGGEIYHFSLTKGSKGISIQYITNFGESLSSTYRTGKNLKDVCIKTINWLVEHDYVRHMPFGYKDKYKNIIRNYKLNKLLNITK